MLAKGLLEFETLSGDEIKDLLDGKRPMRESVIEPPTPRASAVPPAGKGRPRPEPGTGPWSRSRRLEFRAAHRQMMLSSPAQAGDPVFGIVAGWRGAGPTCRLR